MLQEEALPDFGDWNATAAKWAAVMLLQTQKEQYDYIRSNPEMVREIPFKAIRLAFKKMMKPVVRQMVLGYHVQKIAAFKSQRMCFVRLMRVHTSLQCASVGANTGFAVFNNVTNKTTIRLNKQKFMNMTKICMSSVNDIIRLGEAWTENQLMMYIAKRYSFAKTEWIKWKKMIIAVSKSDMSIDTLLNLVVYKIFEPNGLYEQLTAFEIRELEEIKSMIETEKPFDMNMKLPENCNNATCQQVSDWVGPRGVSDAAADMANFQVQDASNATLADINTNLDALRDYEDTLKNATTNAEATQKEGELMQSLEAIRQVL